MLLRGSLLSIALVLTTVPLHAAPIVDAEAEEALAKERCAIRVSIAMTGEAPSRALLSADDPRESVTSLMEETAFIDRFARYVNSQMNDDPGAVSADDAPYHLALHLLENNRPWHELFDGAYRVEVKGMMVNQKATILDDENGLGIFRSPGWKMRYAGNEPNGVEIAIAYRMMHNVVGLHLSPTTNAPGADISAEGRHSPACKGCHYDGPFALDLVANALNEKVARDGQKVAFNRVGESKQNILGDRSVGSDADLVKEMLATDDFKVRTCRIAFKYLYGRSENACEADTFDACVEAFTKSKNIKDAIATFVKADGFCE